MRKTLLATTALAFAGAMAAGPALAADKMSIGVGGYMQQWIGMSSVDATDATGKATANEGGVAQHSDTEIHFKGRLESDNGLTFSVKVELEGNSDDSTSGPRIDESQLTVRGAFGEIVLGAEDPAITITHHGVRDVGFGMVCGDFGHWINGISGCGPSGMGTAGHALGDKNNITYYTPRLNGVQFGATYVPHHSQEGRRLAQLDEGAATWNEDDAVSVGGNYKGEFGGANIAVSAGYYQRSQTMKPVALMSGSNVGKLMASELTAAQDDIDAYKGTRDLMKVGKAKMVEGGGTPAELAMGVNDAILATNRIAAAEDMMASKADAMTVSNFGLQVGFGSFSFDVAYLTKDGGAYKVMRTDAARVDANNMFDPDGKDSDYDGDGNNVDMVQETADLNDPTNDYARSALVKDTSMDNEVVSVGVMYSDGPMAVSLSHTMVDADDGTSQSGTLLSGSYTLAPGIAWRSSLFAAEKSSGTDRTSVEGSGFVTGVTLSF